MNMCHKKEGREGSVETDIAVTNNKKENGITFLLEYYFFFFFNKDDGETLQIVQ